MRRPEAATVSAAAATKAASNSQRPADSRQPSLYIFVYMYDPLLERMSAHPVASEIFRSASGRAVTLVAILG